MSARLQAVQVQCDWCGILGPERLLAASGIIVETELPAGWTGAGYGSVRVDYRIILADSFGSTINHLCPACSTRPVGDLLTHLGQLPERQPA